MENIFDNRILNTGVIFNNYYVEVPALYTQLYGIIPNQYYFNNINGEKLFDQISKEWQHEIAYVFEKSDFNTQKKTLLMTGRLSFVKTNVL
ncbi:hypothetical protein [Niabella hibiscisoli]|uniref:hypothetical protein n=1 Tax=Niabella hibiscisoli TaxID=1825928 RepID=UPI001F0E5832|nr:hypothetical protein [Niabella hibiscisoli]MCH5717877.1 hypothetical protein [Niabella hibiscisoli]